VLLKLSEDLSDKPVQAGISEVEDKKRWQRKQKCHKDIQHQNSSTRGDNIKGYQQEDYHKWKFGCQLHEAHHELLERHTDVVGVKNVTDEVCISSRRALCSDNSISSVVMTGTWASTGMPRGMMFIVLSGMEFCSLTIHALNHPEQKVVLAWEPEVAFVHQPERQQIAPGA